MHGYAMGFRTFWRCRVVERDRGSLTLSAELFNVFNSSTLMVQTRDMAGSAYNRIDGILAPRIVRLGARIDF